MKADPLGSARQGSPVAATGASPSRVASGPNASDQQLGCYRSIVPCWFDSAMASAQVAVCFGASAEGYRPVDRPLLDARMLGRVAPKQAAMAMTPPDTAKYDSIGRIAQVDFVPRLRTRRGSTAAGVPCTSAAMPGDEPSFETLPMRRRYLVRRALADMPSETAAGIRTSAIVDGSGTAAPFSTWSANSAEPWVPSGDDTVAMEGLA